MAARPGATEQTIETLREAQRLGFFGSRPIEEAVDHAWDFVLALGELAPGSRVADIGSGGGLPGLVLAEAYPHCSIVLIDRRQKRTDFLARALSRLGHRHVTVRCEDVARVAVEVADEHEPPFDAVTARGFGPPEKTLRLARQLTSPSGLIVISEPPAGDRWDPVLLAELGVESDRVGRVRRFHVKPR